MIVIRIDERTLLTNERVPADGLSRFQVKHCHPFVGIDVVALSYRGPAPAIDSEVCLSPDWFCYDVVDRTEQIVDRVKEMVHNDGFSEDPEVVGTIVRATLNTIDELNNNTAEETSG